MGLLFPETLSRILSRCPEPKLEEYARELGHAMAEAEIWTVTRMAAFIGQIGWESSELRRWEEGASGEEYERRTDRGNTEPGDGPRFKGRGPIQITFRDTYRECGKALGVDLEAQPELLLKPEWGFRAAAWFWRWPDKPLSRDAARYLGPVRDLNVLADRSDFRGITLAVNGKCTEEFPSFHGRRLIYYHLALEVLGTGARLG